MRTFIKKSALAFAAIATLSACGKKDTPEAAVMAFTNAMNKLDYATAQKYMIDDATSKQLIAMLQGMAALGPEATEMMKKQAAEQAKNHKSAKCTVNGDNATCIICCDANGKDESESIKLVKKDNKWLVKFDASDASVDLKMESAAPTEKESQVEEEEEDIEQDAE